MRRLLGQICLGRFWGSKMDRDYVAEKVKDGYGLKLYDEMNGITNPHEKLAFLNENYLSIGRSTIAEEMFKACNEIREEHGLSKLIIPDLNEEFSRAEKIGKVSGAQDGC